MGCSGLAAERSAFVAATRYSEQGGALGSHDYLDTTKKCVLVTSTHTHPLCVAVFT